MEANLELIECAKINFENLARAIPGLNKHPFYIIAKAQLDEGLGKKDAVMRRTAEGLPEVE